MFSEKLELICEGLAVWESVKDTRVLEFFEQEVSRIGLDIQNVFLLEPEEPNCTGTQTTSSAVKSRRSYLIFLHPKDSVTFREIKWTIRHELAHIIYGDCNKSRFMWLPEGVRMALADAYYLLIGEPRANRYADSFDDY